MIVTQTYLYFVISETSINVNPLYSYIFISFYNFLNFLLYFIFFNIVFIILMLLFMLTNISFTNHLDEIPSPLQMNKVILTVLLNNSCMMSIFPKKEMGIYKKNYIIIEFL
jgi:hypothetical protein